MDQMWRGNGTENQLLRPYIGPVYMSHQRGLNASGVQAYLIVYSYVFSFFVLEYKKG